MVFPPTAAALASTSSTLARLATIRSVIINSIHASKMMYSTTSHVISKRIIEPWYVDSPSLSFKTVKEVYNYIYIIKTKSEL
jgi:hypothetical protein